MVPNPLVKLSRYRKLYKSGIEVFSRLFRGICVPSQELQVLNFQSNFKMEEDSKSLKAILFSGKKEDFMM